LLLVLSLIFPLRFEAQVVLSEFQASNTRTLRDEDGNFEDWIEICNVSSAPVDIGGWSLTDETGQLNKWQFPSTNVAAGQFLIVFASGLIAGESLSGVALAIEQIIAGMVAKP
jgi:hypothetical protein